MNYIIYIICINYSNEFKIVYYNYLVSFVFTLFTPFIIGKNLLKFILYFSNL